MQDFIRDFQEAFVRLQVAGEDMWQFLREYSSLFDATVEFEETNDPIMAFKPLRDAHASALKIIDTLDDLVDSWYSKIDDFARKTSKFKFDINRNARNCGLRRLPDELVVDILDHATDSFKSSVRMSHVCRRFRNTLTWASKHWIGHILTSHLPPSIILTLTERYGDGPLKGEIDLDDKAGRSFDSVTAVIDIVERLDELEIWNWRSGSPSPLSLPDHSLPHPSFPNLIDCTMSLGTVSLKRLLEFLSSAVKLEKLHLEIDGLFDHDDTDSSESISLPSLTMLQFYAFDATKVESYRHFMEKIVPFTVSSLDFRLVGNVDMGPVVDLIHAKPSIRDLRLELWSRDQSLSSIPLHIETLELSGEHVPGTIAAWLRNPELFPAQNLRLLKLGDSQIPSDDILHLKDLFVKLECNQVRFDFEDCDGLEDVLYELGDAHKAILG